jgi:hypothetical protein
MNFVILESWMDFDSGVYYTVVLEDGVLHLIMTEEE